MSHQTQNPAKKNSRSVKRTKADPYMLQSLRDSITTTPEFQHHLSMGATALGWVGRAVGAGVVANSKRTGKGFSDVVWRAVGRRFALI